MFPSGVLLLFSCAFAFAYAISPLHITGTKFFDANGNQVFFKGNYPPPERKCRELTLSCPGIAYQRAPFDPFLNGTQCLLDANLMKTLGVNVIRSTSPFPQQDAWQRLNLQRTMWIPREIMMTACKHSRKII